MQPARDVVPELLKGRLRRGPQKTPTRELITLRLDREVTSALRASGPGWQTRVAAFVKELVLRTPPTTTESAAAKSGNQTTPKAPKRARTKADPRDGSEAALILTGREPRETFAKDLDSFPVMMGISALRLLEQRYGLQGGRGLKQRADLTAIAASSSASSPSTPASAVEFPVPRACPSGRSS